MLQLCGVGRIERIEPRAFFEQTERLVHRLILDRSSHAGPDEVARFDSVSAANIRANLSDLGSNPLDPFGMLLRLPAQVEDAVGILSDVTGGVGFGADGGEKIVRRPER